MYMYMYVCICTYVYVLLATCSANEGVTSEDTWKCKYYAYNYIFVIMNCHILALVKHSRDIAEGIHNQLPISSDEVQFWLFAIYSYSS